MGDNGNGTGYSDLKKGLNTYLSSVGKSKNATYVKGHNSKTINQIMTKIKANRPCIVGTNDDPKYGDHWLVAVGYLKYTGNYATGAGDLYFIKANNGWYTTEGKSIVTLTIIM